MNTMDLLNISLFRTITRNPFFRLLVLLSALSAVVLVGFLRGGLQASNDMKYLFSAGVMWLENSNPYNTDLFAQMALRFGVRNTYQDLVFAYPPWTAPLCYLLGTQTLEQAQAILKIINLICLCLIVFLALQSVKRPDVSQLAVTGSGAWWFLPSLIIGLPPVATTIWQGQTSLIVTATLMGSWYLRQHKSYFLSGILLGIALIKPQLSFLVLFWFILQKEWKILLVAGLTCLFMSIKPMASFGPLDTLIDWYSAVQDYKNGPLNEIFGTGPLSKYVFTLEHSVFHFTGLKLRGFWLIGPLLSFVLWWKRSRIISDDTLPILTGFTIVFGSSHAYDLVLLTPMVAAFYRSLQNHPILIVLALFLMTYVCIPPSYPPRISSFREYSF
jgi:uncharacterized membrane protein YwzB